MLAQFSIPWLVEIRVYDLNNLDSLQQFTISIQTNHAPHHYFRYSLQTEKNTLPSQFALSLSTNKKR